MFIDDEVNQKAKEEVQTITNIHTSGQVIPIPPPPPLLANISLTQANREQQISPPTAPQSPQMSTHHQTQAQTSVPFDPAATPNMSLRLDAVTPVEPPPTTASLTQPSSKNKFHTSQMSLSHQSRQNAFMWNAISEIDMPNQPGKKLIVDRKSWITTLDEQTSQFYPFIYSLDSTGLPKNPMGRTGVRGRGALYRYGPNHEIMVVVTS
jgi:hypothetical protein